MYVHTFTSLVLYVPACAFSPYLLVTVVTPLSHPSVLVPLQGHQDTSVLLVPSRKQAKRKVPPAFLVFCSSLALDYEAGQVGERGEGQAFSVADCRFRLSSSRQPEPPKKEKETTSSSTPSQSKRADEWKDPWRRSKSPKKKHGLSASPSRARRRRKTSASSASASGSSRYSPSWATLVLPCMPSSTSSCTERRKWKGRQTWRTTVGAGAAGPYELGCRLGQREHASGSQPRRN